jgi:hypothetical protein
MHIRIEKILQTAASKVSSGVCSECTDICCQLKFCKESVDSSFLRFILGEKVRSFDQTNGWFVEQHGCSIPYGRPLICYEFFCSRFKNNASVDSLKYYSGVFKKIYHKVSGNQHMLTIKNLNQITVHRLDKIQHDLNDLEQNTINTFGRD